MAGLKRFITYLYKYENDIKQENTGFAKVEFRGSSGRMEVHVRNLNLEVPGCMIYLFARKGEIMQGVPMGEIQIRHGNGDVRYIFDEKNLNAFGVSMKQMEGIFISVSQEIYIASQWKEGEVQRENFHILEKKEQSKEQRTQQEETQRHRGGSRREEAGRQQGISGKEKFQGPKENQKQQTVREREELKRQQAAQGEEGQEKGGIQEAEESDISEKMSNAKGEMSEGETPEREVLEREVSEREAENLKATEIPMEKFAEEVSLERVFHKLRLKLTVFYPFLGESIECVKIDITDLSELPRKYWYLGKNSFLLHGFFNYRHLIMGEIREGEKSEYFIGVPGVFQNQERIMASMFGFPEFRTAEQTQYKTGNFGYWYRVI